MTVVTNDQILERIKQVLKQFGADPDKITPDATFEQLDVDSLDVVELGQVIEEEYGVELTAEDAKGLKTVGQAIDLVVARAA